jgi:hypothetical protein
MAPETLNDPWAVVGFRGNFPDCEIGKKILERPLWCEPGTDLAEFVSDLSLQNGAAFDYSPSRLEWQH